MADGDNSSTAPQACFVCERPFAPCETPAETWARDDRAILVCRRCVLDPPGGSAAPMEALPEEIRFVLLLHLRSHVLRNQSRAICQTAKQLRDTSACVRARIRWIASERRRGDGEDAEPPK